MIDVNVLTMKEVNRTLVIPPRPEILTQLKKIIDSEDPSLLEIANIVAQDVAISSATLKLVNSPILGLSRTVTDIRQAVMFLGFNGIHTLVQGIKLKETFSASKY